MSDSVQTVADLIEAFGGPSQFGKIIGKGPSTASEMKRSGSIRVEYWPAIIGAAQARLIEGITYESLALMHARKAPAPTEGAQA